MLVVAKCETNMPAHLFPPVEPFAAGWLDVGDGHRLYHEQCGGADGLPVLFLHGGPGSGCSPRHRRLFDPERYRSILFDQRGCGRSLPRGGLNANTSAHLVQDIESLRQHLGVERWWVVGGSWGAALALAYASAYPQVCSGMVLRSVFLGRSADIDWFFRDARHLEPQAWISMVEQVALAPGETLLERLYRGLHWGPPVDALLCAQAWMALEQALDGSRNGPLPAPALVDAAALIDKYRVQSHYLMNGCFWDESDLLTRARELSSIPTVILHGEHDRICRPQSALDLHAAMPGSELHWVAGCGHELYAPAMLDALGSALGRISARQ